MILKSIIKIGVRYLLAYLKALAESQYTENILTNGLNWSKDKGKPSLA